MTDVQERTTFKFVSLISIEELSIRLLDSTRVFDTPSVRCFVHSKHPVRHLRDVCHAETQGQTFFVVVVVVLLGNPTGLSWPNNRDSEIFLQLLPESVQRRS